MGGDLALRCHNSTLPLEGGGGSEILDVQKPSDPVLHTSIPLQTLEEQSAHFTVFFPKLQMNPESDGGKEADKWESELFNDKSPVSSSCCSSVKELSQFGRIRCEFPVLFSARLSDHTNAVLVNELNHSSEEWVCQKPLFSAASCSIQYIHTYIINIYIYLFFVSELYCCCF